MALKIKQKSGVEFSTELYAPAIHIRGNPEDKPAGSIQLELVELEYRDEEFVRMIPLGVVGETVGDFAAREFEVNGKTITGLDIVAAVEQYTAEMYQERFDGESDPA